MNGPYGDLVSNFTYIDLAGLQLDEFQLELEILHGQLQYVATGGTTDRYHIFYGQAWWFSIKILPEQRNRQNDVWVQLNSRANFSSIVEHFENACRGHNAVLELTNVGTSSQKDKLTDLTRTSNT